MTAKGSFGGLLLLPRARTVGGPVSARRFVAGLVSAVALLGACGQAATPAGSDGRPVADCEALAEEAADLLVVLADHAAADGGGLPPSALQAEHPEDLGPWELAAALADGSHDLQIRVASAEDAADRLGCRRGRLHDTIDTRIDDELPGVVASCRTSSIVSSTPR